MEEETEYEEVYECNHSYNRRCTTSYTTTYTAQQEQECEDNYKKNCFIQYSPTAYQATVQICKLVVFSHRDHTVDISRERTVYIS
jgi:hypothetical protein